MRRGNVRGNRNRNRNRIGSDVNKFIFRIQIYDDCHICLSLYDFVMDFMYFSGSNSRSFVCSIIYSAATKVRRWSIQTRYRSTHIHRRFIPTLSSIAIIECKKSNFADSFYSLFLTVNHHVDANQNEKCSTTTNDQIR